MPVTTRHATRMIKQLSQWLGGEEPPSDEQKLREISLEYDEVDLKAATQDFHTSRRLGSGNYGAVYRGTLPDGHEVAVKVLDIDENADDCSGFADEVRVLSKFRHPNLVTLMGWGTGKGEKGKKRRFLVYELLSGGDVAQRLQSCRTDGGRPFRWDERLWVALDASCGLSHMHNSTPRAFHRDIKSANILLDRSGTAKMADFGLSGIAKNKDKLNMTCEQISGTPGYACPHYIKSGKVTEKTEVYAFGMVMMELLLNSMPACLGQNGNILYPIFQVVQPGAPGALQRALAAVDPKAGWPPALASDVAEFALVCSHLKEDTRPTFTEVGCRLRQWCEQHCKGHRAAPSTDPKMDKMFLGGGYPGAAGPPTAPQMHISGPCQGAVAPTRPQMGPGMIGAAGSSAPTRPQMGMPVGITVAAPPTRPQMLTDGCTPTRPQMLPGEVAIQPPTAAGAAAPTRPQIATGRAPEAGGDVPTRPQLGGIPGQVTGMELPTRPQIGVGQSLGPGNQMPTRPQMGLGCPVPGTEMPTRPQMGLSGGTVDPPGGEMPTRPQMATGHASSLGVEAPTRPQLGLGMSPPSLLPAGSVPTRPQMAAPGPGAPPVTKPTLHAALAVGCQRYDEVLRDLLENGCEGALEGGGSLASAADLADMVLECTAADGVDLGSMPLRKRCLAFRQDAGPWTVGRQQQADLFTWLVPVEDKRTCISRSHFILSWQKLGLRLKKLSPNMMLVNGKPAPPQQEIDLAQGTEIGFCGKDNLRTFLTFTVRLRDRSAPHPQVQRTQQQQQPQQLQQPQQPQLTLQPSHMQTQQQPQPQQQPQQRPPPQQLEQQGLPVTQQEIAAYQKAHSAPVLGFIPQPSASGASIPKWWYTGPATPYTLTCVMAFGYDVSLLPPEARTIGLRCDGPLSVGRLHQQGFFEGLLGEEPGQRYLCCVSRSHLEVQPARGEGRGCFQVANQSANPVLLAGRRKLGKGDAGTIRPGDSVEFIGNRADGSGASVTYLKLRLDESVEATRAQRPTPVAEERAAPAAETRGPSPSRRVEFQEPLPERQAPPPTPVPMPVLALAAQEPAAGPLAPGLSPAAALLPPVPELRPEEPPPFSLLLAGSAVRANFAADMRLVEGRPEGLTVGRAHQQALHANAFEPQLRQYLSRDHFRIECGRDYACRLVPLSSNPIWRLHAGELREAIKGEPAMRLVHGDEIMLFTGADDCTPDGPGNLGLLRWIFQDHSVEADGIDGPTMRALPPTRRGPAAPQALPQADDKNRGCFFGWGEDGKGLPTTPRRARAKEAVAERPGGRSPRRAPVSRWDAGDVQNMPPSRDTSIEEVDDKFAASGFRY